MCQNKKNVQNESNQILDPFPFSFFFQGSQDRQKGQIFIITAREVYQDFMKPARQAPEEGDDIF